MKYEELQINLPPVITPRADGVHVKEIINAMAQEFGIWDRESNPIWLEEAAQMGLAWEGFMIRRLRSVGTVLHRSIRETEGIWCSPDGYEQVIESTIDGNDTVKSNIIHEFKIKWMSVDKYPFEDTKWWDAIAQIKAYCHAWNTTNAVLHVLYVNGDYKFKNTITGFPARRHYRLTFTELELQENWQQIINFAKEKEIIK